MLALAAMGVVASGMIGSPWPAEANAIRHGIAQAPQTTGSAQRSGNPKLLAHDAPRPAAPKSFPQSPAGYSALDCEATWRTAPTPDPAGSYRELNALGAASGTDIWAVGDYANAAGTYRTLAEHWNGYSWTIVPTPNVGAGNNLLLSVAAIASNDAWAVGVYRQSNTDIAQTLTEHWNGSSWSVVASPNVANMDNALFGVRAISSTNVVAVGRALTSNTNAQSLVEQWNGTGWSIVPTPNGSSFSELIAVDALSATNIWAVGDQTSDASFYTTLVEHWDGVSWTVVPSPNFSGFGGFLESIGGTAANDLWAVGGFTITGGQQQTAIAHYDGTSWSAIASPTGTSSELFAIGVVSSTNAWAVGSNFYGSYDMTLVEHWDGTGWSIVQTTQPGVVTNDLFDIAAVSASEMWTVGRTVNTSNVFETAAQNYCLPPSLSSLAPTSGPATGGTAVTIRGTGFSWATGVSFGGTPAASFSVTSDTQIIASSPQQQAGTVEVKINYFLGTSQSVRNDQYTVTPTPPTAPANVAALGGEASATVYWQAPFDGGTPITGYTITTSPPTTSTMAPAGATSALVTGLTDGVTYTLTVTATNSIGTGPASAPSNAVTPGRGQYRALTPARILDTRIGLGAPLARLGQGGSLNVQVTGQGGVPATGVAAVVLNVTVTDTTAGSYLTVWPKGVPRPLASNLNWTAGKTVPNLVEVAVGVEGKVSIFNALGSTDVIFDVAGYVASPVEPAGVDGRYTPLVPERVLDTRLGTGGVPEGAVGPGGTVSVRMNGQAGLPPTGVAAVVLNVTVTGPTAPSYLTVYPTGSSQPTASNLNFVAGQTVPNRVIVKVGSNGTTEGWVSFFNAAGSTHIIADIGGWFSDGSNPAATGTRFVGVTPTRILDTRTGTGGFSQPVGPEATIAATVAGVGGVPAMNATVAPSAVVLNVTVTDTTGQSYLTVWPDGAGQPTASDLNWVTGLTVPNLVVVKVGSTGKIDLYNQAGSTNVIIDVVGWYG
jgi:fibronectin type III domain protein/IPT/TIG domain-containing protein